MFARENIPMMDIRLNSCRHFKVRFRDQPITSQYELFDLSGGYVVVAHSHFAVIRQGVDTETGEAFGG